MENIDRPHHVWVKTRLAEVPTYVNSKRWQPKHDLISPLTVPYNSPLTVPYNYKEQSTAKSKSFKIAQKNRF